MEVERVAVISRGDPTRAKFAVTVSSPAHYHGDPLSRLGVMLRLRVGDATRELGLLQVSPCFASPAREVEKKRCMAARCTCSTPTR